MSDDQLLELDSVQLAPRSRELTLAIGSGEAYGVIGPLGAAVSEFVSVARGATKPAGGTVRVRANANPVDPVSRRPGRATGSSLFKGKNAERAHDALVGLGVWEQMHAPWAELGRQEQSALRLAARLADPPGLVAFDHELDTFDPWTLAAALDAIDRSLAEGFAFLIGTARTEVVERLGNVVVFKGSEPLFAGPVQGLIARARASELVVETDEASAVAAVAEPFALRVVAKPGEVWIQAADGQALAARLLTEGYGRIRSVVVRTPTLEDALFELI